MRNFALRSLCAAALLGSLSLSTSAFSFGHNIKGFEFANAYSWGPACPEGTNTEGQFTSLFSGAMNGINILYPNPVNLVEGSDYKSEVSTWCKTRITIAVKGGYTMADMDVDNRITSRIYSGNERITVETTLDPGTLDFWGPDRHESSFYDFTTSDLAVHTFKEVGNIGDPFCHVFRYATFTITTKMTLKYDSADDNESAASLDATFLNFGPLKENTNAARCVRLFHSFW